jgi:acyl dehydratase
MHQDPLYFDDLAVGMRFSTGTLTMTEDEIIAFARLYDAQPFHTDKVRARDSLFGELVASGWHTAAMSMRLLIASGPRFAGGIVGTGGELLWPRPVRPGDTLRVVTEILALTPSRSRPDRGSVQIRNETRNQEDEVVQSFSPRLVVPRRPGSS